MRGNVHVRYLRGGWRSNALPLPDGEAASEALHELAASLGKDTEESFMTTAETLRAEGQAKMLVQMLTAKFGPLPDSVSEKVQEASGTQVQEWAIRTMTAEKLDDIFD